MESSPVTAMQTVGLSRNFGDIQAVDNVDLSVAAGEIHALVGLNGAGKTTLLRLILGMMRPDSGRAMVAGVDTARADAGVVVCLLTSMLALTIGLAASVGRGYLPGFGALIGLVAISQVAVLFGSGGWFPFAAPALWAVSWQDSTLSVDPAQFALVILTAAAGILITTEWWSRFEVS